MKTSQIQNAFVKNKPNYNYQIYDQDNVLVAKGHLINSKQKQKILNYMNYSITQSGEISYKVDSMIDFFAEWILQSIDWWIWQDVPITKQTVYEMEIDVIKWLSEQIQKQISKSMQLVEQNEKNQ